jgi:hypothetical protein
VTTEDGPVVLGPLDSCVIPPGETRSVQNATNRPASMLVYRGPVIESRCPRRRMIALTCHANELDSDT